MKLKTRESGNIRLAWCFDVCIKSIYGITAECAFAWSFYNFFYTCLLEKALYPIYTYVLLNGLFTGFATWWIPYLYLWTILWGVTMLLPRKIPKKIQPIVYMVVNACHGFLFGTLYAPAQAILFGLSFKGMIAWIIAGLPWDFVHGISNFFCGILIVPIVTLLWKLEKQVG